MGLFGTLKLATLILVLQILTFLSVNVVSAYFCNKEKHCFLLKLALKMNQDENQENTDFSMQF